MLQKYLYDYLFWRLRRDGRFDDDGRINVAEYFLRLDFQLLYADQPFAPILG